MTTLCDVEGDSVEEEEDEEGVDEKRGCLRREGESESDAAMEFFDGVCKRPWICVCRLRDCLWKEPT
jgi:transposase-like protein